MPHVLIETGRFRGVLRGGAAGSFPAGVNFWREGTAMMTLTIDGMTLQAEAGERLIDVVNRAGSKIPQVCYHPQLGPIQTCDTCMVETGQGLARACGTTAADGMNNRTNSPQAATAQREAFDRILSNHVLYCTVCD